MGGRALSRSLGISQGPSGSSSASRAKGVSRCDAAASPCASQLSFRLMDSAASGGSCAHLSSTPSPKAGPKYEALEGLSPYLLVSFSTVPSLGCMFDAVQSPHSSSKAY